MLLSGVCSSFMPIPSSACYGDVFKYRDRTRAMGVLITPLWQKNLAVVREVNGTN